MDTALGYTSVVGMMLAEELANAEDQVGTLDRTLLEYILITFIAVVVCDYFIVQRCYFFLSFLISFPFIFSLFLFSFHMTKEKTSIGGAHQEHWCLQPSPPADKTSSK